MKYINTKFSFCHRVGNILQGFVSIAENLVMILTFSYVMPNWMMKLNIMNANDYLNQETITIITMILNQK